MRTDFESGGNEMPQIMAGFEGAEIHAHYEISQRRMESTGVDDMLDSLSAALFKTTGDAKFKPDEEKVKQKEEEDRLAVERAQAKREKWEPQYKYKVPKFGDSGSSTMDVDDTNA